MKIRSHIRTRSINMPVIFRALNDEYNNNLKVTLGVYADANKAAEETYNDYLVVAGKVGLLKTLDLINDNEEQELLKYFSTVRTDALKKIKNRVTENK